MGMRCSANIAYGYIFENVEEPEPDFIEELIFNNSNISYTRMGYGEDWKINICVFIPSTHLYVEWSWVAIQNMEPPSLEENLELYKIINILKDKLIYENTSKDIGYKLWCYYG